MTFDEYMAAERARLVCKALIAWGEALRLWQGRCVYDVSVGYPRWRP